MKCSLTVLFEAPFWIGLYERIDENKYEVCKITFWCCIIKVDTLFSRILIYNHNQYENRRKTYGTESKIL